MCGIAGFVNGGRPSRDDREWLERSVLLLRHRGPDAQAQWIDENGHVGLTHTRLAIVDLGESSDQPYHYSNGDFTIVFNGEIYNWAELNRILQVDLGRKASPVRSDTHLIALAFDHWGVGCFDRFTGMFAIGIYIHGTQNLILARDKVGEKPLFFSLNGSRLCFSSSIKNLASHPEVGRRLSPYGFPAFLTRGFVAGSETILESVRELEPGCFVTFDATTQKLYQEKYYNPPSFSFGPTLLSIGDAEGALIELDRILDSSVGQCLKADVPVCIALSGGIDSSLVAFYAAKHVPRISTYSITNNGVHELNEAGFARRVATILGTNHNEYDTEDFSPVDLEKVLRAVDHPVADSSFVPMWILSSTIRRKYKVALSGDGADELFGGYTYYKVYEHYFRLLGILPHSLRSFAATGIRAILPEGTRGRNFLRHLIADYQTTLPDSRQLFTPTELRRLFPSFKGIVGSGAALVGSSCELPMKQVVERLMEHDFRDYLPSNILSKVDQMSMAHGLELRAPILHPDLIAFSRKYPPSSWRSISNARKVPLTILANRQFRSEVNFDRKQGLSIPFSSWARKDSYILFLRRLLSDSQLIDRVEALKFLERHRSGEDHGERIFALASLEMWARDTGVTL